MRRVWVWGAVLAAFLVSLPAVRLEAQPLIEAIRSRDAAAVRRLLEGGADVRVASPDGATPLHWAIHLNDLDTAGRLIERGADVNATNDYGVTPLLLACEAAPAPAAALLLKAGANPNQPLPTGETPLMRAAHTGNDAVVRALAEAGANVNAQERQQGQNALMWAASAGHAAVVRALLERGADPNVRSAPGVTPLLFTARQGSVDTARVLLAAGADVNATAADRLSALVIATVRDHAALAMFFLDHGANPNQIEAGYTALHWAAGVWETELTGPRGIATDRDEEWRALRGVRAGRLDLIKALLAHGADANALITRAPQRVGFTRGGLNLIGATPFLVAAASGDAEVMRLVRAAGADPALATKDGTTPLMAAAGVGRVSAESLIEENSAVDAVKEAIAAGGDVNGANSGGDTALHGAASMRWSAMVRFLIERGALIDVTNKRGRTPLANAAGSSTADLLRPPAGPAEPDVPVR